jgi:hypothetical protein
VNPLKIAYAIRDLTKLLPNLRLILLYKERREDQEQRFVFQGSDAVLTSRAD